MNSGAFSLAHQSVQLGFTPRLTIVHTSISLEALLTDLERRPLPRVPGTAVFLTSDTEGAPVVTATYGFMETPNVPEILYMCRERGLKSKKMETSYFLGARARIADRERADGHVAKEAVRDQRDSGARCPCA